MFTGIIDHCGKIVNCQSALQSKRISIASEFNDLKLGDSIAVNGACLTVTQIEDSYFTVDVSPETLNITNLHTIKVDDQVNLEKPMRLSDYVNGHLVSGHIEALFKVLRKENVDDFLLLRLGSFAEQQRPYLLHKGSITLNGVSLTINKIDHNDIEVLLIPETLRRTNLIDLQIGNWVNVEYDMVVKAIAHQTSLFFERSIHVE